jgi:hypothetical protein
LERLVGDYFVQKGQVREEEELLVYVHRGGQKVLLEKERGEGEEEATGEVFHWDFGFGFG